MKFTKIEDKVQLGERGYIRHKIVEMPEGELVQKCVLCGQIIADYRRHKDAIRIDTSTGHLININDYIEKGWPEGYMYISIQQNPSSKIHESLTELGAIMPTDFIDCTVINS